MCYGYTHANNNDIFKSQPNKKFLNNKIAVSYTHLDVYKRQGLPINKHLNKKFKKCP